MTGKEIAQGLAWFGIGLGLAEVLAPRAVARAAGVDKHADVVRLFGFREIVSGVVILAAEEPEDWLWIRVLGDGLDGALLGSGMRPGNPHWARALLATAIVAPVVALDALYARRPPR